MEKIIIINEGESPNIGDRAIKFCFEKLLENQNYETYFIPYTGDGKKNVTKPVGIHRIVNKNTSIKKFLKVIVPTQFIFLLKWFLKKSIFIFKKRKEIREANRVFIGGGQLLNDNRIFPYALFFWVYCFSVFMKKKVYIVAVGYGNDLRGSKKFCLDKALKKCSGIYLRDYSSIERIRENYAVNCDYIPDLVFTISDYIHVAKIDSKQAVVIPTSYQYVYLKYNSSRKSEEEYIDEWISEIVRLIKEGYQVSVTITDTNQDKKIYNDILSKIDTLNYNVTGILPSSLQSLCSIIGKTSYVYSGRMHALIIGKSYRCECKIYPISDKLRVFEKECNDSTVRIEEKKINISNKINEII